MEVTISASALELRQLLTAFLVAKFCPDERQLVLGNPPFEAIVQEALAQFIKLEGDEEFRRLFERSYLEDQEINLLASQVSDILSGTGLDRKDAGELLEQISAPALLSVALKNTILGRVEV
ncbi:hypothetical protein NBRC116594_14580 [Shimia sp. NS0008-38b]|uniref:hypothetical protein n=1 Tax=Shimia sp. NS0008-38b TaxID=3127653 RepID=UPI00310C2268